MGLLIIRYAICLLEKGKLNTFAWYCLIVGIGAVYYLSIKR
jgi:undecaprenyl pyrophosphate phosphatase UppP